MTSSDGQRGQRDELDRAGQPIERQRARDIGRVGLAPPVAHVGVVHQRVAIDARAGERAGRARPPSPPPASRHWASGAAPRRAGPRASASRPTRPTSAAAASTSHSAASREAGRLIEVVEAGRRPAERIVPRRPVADHAVGGVDGLVDHAARQAAERRPEQPARRCRRRNSRPGSRWRPATRRPRRAPRCCGRRSCRPPRGRSPGPVSSASATARTCSSRLRWAGRLAARNASSSHPAHDACSKPLQHGGKPAARSRGARRAPARPLPCGAGGATPRGSASCRASRASGPSR